MSRYIDADKLKEECYKFTNDVSRSAMAFVQGQINAAPTADVVEVRHGRWETEFAWSYGYDDHHRLTCSECGLSFTEDARRKNEYKYCYQCGAKMDGERKDDGT
jgi:hypothetical protein